MAPERTVCEEVIVHIRKIIRAIELHSRYLVQCCGLTGPQLVVMKEISGGGEATVGEVARRISLSHATVSGILDRLESRGLVRRVRGCADRRNVLVTLTDSGVRVLDEAPQLLHETFVAEFQSLGAEEQGAILSSLRRVASMMSAYGVAATPVLMSGSPVATGESTIEYLAQAEDEQVSEGRLTSGASTPDLGPATSAAGAGPGSAARPSSTGFRSLSKTHGQGKDGRSSAVGR
jgi:DNA-binding MarR family transcriptional regulator